MSASSIRQLRSIDLGVLAVVAVFLSVGVAVYAQGVRAVSNRIACADNLHKIGVAIMHYSEAETQNGLSYPRVKWDPNAPLSFFTGANQPDSFGPNGPKANDVTASFFLVLKTQQLDPRVMHCPESKSKLLVYGTAPGALAKSASANSNFPGIEYMSYSMQVPFPSQNAIMTGFRWNETQTPEHAAAADLNPGVGATRLKTADTRPAGKPVIKSSNSQNHGGDGQNVLYVDSHVEWHSDPYAGPEITEGANTWRDNIYTARTAAGQSTGGKVYAQPFDSDDDILLPAQGYKPGAVGQ